MDDAAKEVVKPGEAVKRTAPGSTKSEVEQALESQAGASEQQAQKQEAQQTGAGKKWFKFIKRFSPADPIPLKSYPNFSFPLILRNSGGYSPGSELLTQDETLASELREIAAKVPGYGIIEQK